MEEIGGDMVSWIYSHYVEISFKADKLWRPEQGSNKGQASNQAQFDPTSDDSINQVDDDGGHDDKTRFSDTEGSTSAVPPTGPTPSTTLGADGLPQAMPDGSPNSPGSSGPTSDVSSLTGKPRDALRTLVGKQASTKTKEGSELRRLVQGFAAQAHLQTDATQTQLSELEQKKAAAAAAKKVAEEKSTAAGPQGGNGENQRQPAGWQSSGSGSSSRTSSTMFNEQETASEDAMPGGVPAGSAVLFAVASLALGVAFQNQKAWADVSSSRYSRMEYSALM
jgi:hypothetical protein